MKKYIKLIRMKHWLKNGLIFFPLFFGGELLDRKKLLITILGFLAFSFIASVIYIINDINDIENDKSHPRKCKRPLASGEITKNQAITIAIGLGLCAVFLNILACQSNWLGFILLAIYLATNILYSKGLKNVPIIDVLILVLGYVIRIYYGAELINVKVSNWLFLTVLFMAFFLGLGKRRNELLRQGTDNRKVLDKYTQDFLNSNMYVSLGLTIVFYSLWCSEMSDLKNNNFVMFTIPLVVSICMKYNLNIEQEDDDGDPMETLLKDKLLSMLIIIYVICMLSIFYIA